MILKYKVENNNYESINQIIKQKYDVSARLLSKLITNKKIMVNNETIDTRIVPKLNDVIEIYLDLEEDNSNIMPTKMNLDIVYEDEGLLIINKPAGITAHPSLRHYRDSLSNGIKYYYDEISLKKKIRPVNRIDLNTSGLVIFAKNEYIQECLIKQMNTEEFEKEYVCITEGIFKEKQGIINAPIARKEKSIIERCISKEGQEAITQYEVLKEKENYSVVKCILKTGRTHQIRVHMSYIKHPIIGDTLYGTSSNLINRQALHCFKMSFFNPFTQNKLEVKSDIPKDIDNLI